MTNTTSFPPANCLATCCKTIQNSEVQETLPQRVAINKEAKQKAPAPF